MIGIFKQKNPANILLLLLFGVLLKLPMFLSLHVPLVQHKDGILFQSILGLISKPGDGPSIIFPVLAFTLLYTQALTLNRLINDQRMMQRVSYLPGMSYLLITSLFPEWNYFSAPLLINSILLFVLFGLFRIYNNQRAKGIIYNIGLAIGVASFIFFPSVTFIIWVLFGLMIMRPFRINESLLCLLGLTTPYYFYAVILFLEGQWSLSKILPYLNISLPGLQQSIWLAGSAFLIMVPFLLGGYYIQDNLRKMLIQVRKGWSLLLIYLLVAICLPFINTHNSYENWVMSAVPFAAFHASAYLYPVKKTVPLIIFWLTVIFILAYQYSGYGPAW